MRKSIIQDLVALRPGQIHAIRHYNSSFEFQGKFIWLFICPVRRTRTGLSRWLLKIKKVGRHNAAIICTMKEDYSGVRDFYVKKQVGDAVNKFILLRDGHPWLSDAVRLERLSELFAYISDLDD